MATNNSTPEKGEKNLESKGQAKGELEFADLDNILEN